MSYDFKKLMSSKTDDEILAVLASEEGDYIDEALQAAKEEFNVRNLSSDKLSAAKVMQDFDRHIESENLKEKNKGVAVILWIKIGILLLVIFAALVNWALNRIFQ